MLQIGPAGAFVPAGPINEKRMQSKQKVEDLEKKISRLRARKAAEEVKLKANFLFKALDNETFELGMGRLDDQPNAALQEG